MFLVLYLKSISPKFSPVVSSRSFIVHFICRLVIYFVIFHESSKVCCLDIYFLPVNIQFFMPALLLKMILYQRYSSVIVFSKYAQGSGLILGTTKQEKKEETYYDLYLKCPLKVSYVQRQGFGLGHGNAIFSSQLHVLFRGWGLVQRSLSGCILFPSSCSLILSFLSPFLWIQHFSSPTASYHPFLPWSELTLGWIHWKPWAK